MARVLRDASVNADVEALRVDAVISPCASRKSVRPDERSRAISLPISDQPALETAWLERLRGLEAVTSAKSLYAGRGFHLAVKTAESLQAPLFILSAGLGLVAAHTKIPSYGITVADRGEDSVGARVQGRFDSRLWWSALSRSPFSSPLPALFRGKGLVLAAFSQPYAKMIGSNLDAISDFDLGRLRIFGLNVSGSLPPRVRSSVLPYDERLQSVLPGTRADFAHRAMFHFSSAILASSPSNSYAEHRELVTRALSGKESPIMAERVSLTDDAIIEAILKRLASGAGGIQRTLRAIRHEDRIRCEQARFSRLYKCAESLQTPA